MIPLLHLPANTETEFITVKDVLRKDLLRLFLSTGVLLLLFYGIGALIADLDNNRFPAHYYIQSIFAYPTVRLITPLGFCVLVMGLKRDERWWSCLIASTFIFVVNPMNRALLLDLSGILSLGFVILLVICAWRLWDYYELRRIYHFKTPYLTRPALVMYIILAILAAIMLLPY